MKWPPRISNLDARQRYFVMPLLALALVLFWFVAVDPFLDYRESLGKEIVENRQRIAMWEAYLNKASSLPKQREQLEQRRREIEQQLLPGGTPTLAAAALQDKLHGFAQESGVNVQSTQVMREESVGELKRISIRMTVTGQIRPLAEFLTAVEYGPYRVVVPFLEISMRGARLRGQAGRALAMTLEVSGFLQNAPASAKKRKEDA